MYHRVDRPFSGGGVDRLRGEAIDPDAWLHGRRLIDQRFIAAGAIGHEPIACPCGRRWVGEVVVHACAPTVEAAAPTAIAKPAADKAKAAPAVPVAS